jgi:Spy/CpxP family protein refolding chaperone
MKKLLLVCAFVIGVSAVSFAQNGGGGGRNRMNPEKMTARLKDSLSLTADQVTKVTAIFTSQAKSQDSLRTANTGGDRAAMRPAQTALRKATSDKILAILTPEQATLYKKQLANQAARQRQRN